MEFGERCEEELITMENNGVQSWVLFYNVSLFYLLFELKIPAFQFQFQFFQCSKGLCGLIQQYRVWEYSLINTTHFPSVYCPCSRIAAVSCSKSCPASSLLFCSVSLSFSMFFLVCIIWVRSILSFHYVLTNAYNLYICDANFWGV